jgi:nicotinamide riboside kinase
MAWIRPAKIAFIGSHSVRKTNAVHAFASAVGRAGRSVEVGREVIRFNPLGRNETATAEAQLWVLMAQVQQELELFGQADILVCDRSVVDNFAYFLRVTDGADPFGVEPLVRRWAQTYDLFVRLLPDVELLPDGVRSTNDAFRDEVEAILDRIVPNYVSADRCVRLPASEVTEGYDWQALAERLAALVGQPLRDPVEA